MADRDVTVDILARDKTGPATKSAAKSFRDVDGQAKRTVAAAKEVAAQWGRGLSKIGSKAKAWSESGDSSGKRFVRGIGNALGKLSEIGGAIGQNLSKSIQAAGPYVQLAIAGVLVAAAVVAAPAIGSAIGGAMVGGAAFAGVGAGLALAAKDARVVSAFSDLKEYAVTQLQEAAQSFVPAALDAVDDARVAFQALLPDLRQLFDSTSSFVAPLTRSLGRAAQVALAGITRAVQNAGPIIGVIGDGIEAVGVSIGRAFTLLSNNGASMALALKGAFLLVTVAIDQAAYAINMLAETFEFFVKSIPGGQRWLDSLKSSQDATTSSTSGLAAGFLRVASDADAAARGITAVKEAADELVDNTLSLKEAQIRAREATAAAAAAIKENGKALDINKEKGRENQQMLVNLARAYNAETQAGIASGLSADQAAAAYQRNRDALIKQAIAAGYTKDQAKRLADQYLQTPATVNTKVALSGAQAALTNIQKLTAEANRFQGTYTATMRINYVTYGKPYSGPTGIGGSTSRGYDSSASWMARDSSGGTTARAGGPTPVEVKQSLTVSLDGRPFRAYTAEQIRESERRQEWRTRVGRR